MEGILFIGLFVVGLGVALGGGIALVHTLFAADNDRARKVGSVRIWLPPFLRGDELRGWAATTTKASVQTRLMGRRTGDGVMDMMRELEEGAVHAMLPLAGQADLERVVPCPKEGQGAFGITAPEALAIAAEVRRRRTRREQQAVYELAMENAKKLVTHASGEAVATLLRCPLQDENRICCAYAARPLHCLPLHAKSVARGAGEDGPESPDASMVASTQDEYESGVGLGVQIGLREGLKSAGFEAEVYEFNSALAKALEVPDAAERWAGGEDVFATCRRFELAAARPRVGVA